MTDQFNPKRFARGVKLTREHLTDTLTGIQSVANRADVEGVAENTGVSRSTWVIPWLQSADVILPFPMPPFQEMFDRTTLQDPDYTITLMDLSLSFDQRGEALAVCGSDVSGRTGQLIAPDMSRLDMMLTLWERTPTIISNPVDTTKAREVLRVELSGEDVFGNAFAKGNPFLLGDVRVNIKPFSTYFWRVQTPGLLGNGSGAVYDCTVGGGYVADDKARLTVGVDNYDYKVLLGDTPDMVALGVAAVAAADKRIAAVPLGGGGGVVRVTVRNPSYNPAVATMFTFGAGTFVTVLIIPAVAATKNPIALPSFTLSGVFCSLLTARDVNDPVTLSIQNMPTKHQGDKGGTAIGLTIPAANAVITGTDIQDAQLGDFDRTLRERVGTGYGAGFGSLADPMQASDSPVEELPSIDAHYMMIVVPLWGTFGMRDSGALVSRDVPAAGIPNFATPWETQITDRRVFPVPENFTLHHAFAVWNNLGGLRNTEATYEQKVSVAITSGRNADDYLEQMVAYLAWTGANYANYRVDQYDRSATFTAYALLAMPIVGPVGLVNQHSWNTGGTNGLPFSMGRGNSTTNTRANCGQMPPAFGGGGYIAPVTAGGENLLEVRWSKQDATLGLYNDDPATTLGENVVIGAGGEWVILCGKVVLSA